MIRIRTLTLLQVLRDCGAPAEIDYFSIDIEGAEERVLSAFDFTAYRFKCLTIERPSACLREKFRANGYVLVRDLPWLDGCYVHESFMGQYEKNFFAFYQRRLPAGRLGS